MSESQAEIQAQLEDANRRLMEKRRALGIRDDRPVHVGDVVDVVIADLRREAEEGR
jgi:hypothetical protein